MAKKFYAQTDALGFPIPGTMMSASEVPAVDNILEITTEMHLPAHPGDLKYYIRLDEKGAILPNSLFVHYDVLDQDDVVSLQQPVVVPPVEHPVVTASAATDVTATTLIVPFSYTNPSSETILEVGVALGTSVNPDKTSPLGANVGAALASPLSLSVEDLTAATVYYARAYVTTAAGTFYSNNITVTTLA